MRLSLQPVIFVFSLFLIFTSCKKTSDIHSSSPVVNVYITGTDNNDAVYWKNNTEVHLTNGSSNAYGSSIFVNSNNDVYVSGGQVISGSASANYWKNGQLNSLANNGDIASIANYISVSGSDVYVTGMVEKTGANPHAVYWKNGLQYGYVDANSVALCGFVSGTDVYLAGYTINTLTTSNNIISDAMYEKNNTPVDISTGNVGGVVQSLYVSGNSVYAAGYSYDTQGIFNYATIWLNNVPTLLSKQKSSAAQGIFVYQNDVYVCGFESLTNGGTFSATVWKNGVPTHLSTQASSATSIFVNNGDVYVSGTTTDAQGAINAVYWKNGTITNIGAAGSSARAIFVK